jgi:hypothetical protein
MKDRLYYDAVFGIILTASGFLAMTTPYFEPAMVFSMIIGVTLILGILNSERD